MEKLVYLLWRPSKLPVTDAGDRIEEAARAVLGDGAGPAALTLFTPDPAVGAAFPPPEREGEEFFGAVSLWLASLDDRGPVHDALTGTGCTVDGYLVAESIPRDYPSRDWPDGQPSPGVTMLTWFDKPDRLDEDTFFARWHGSHTPLALEVHPLVRYVRNTVVRSVTEGAPRLRGIVGEHVAELADLTDGHRFFSRPENMERVVKDAASFLDLEQTRSAVVRETIMRSRGPLY